MVYEPNLRRHDERSCAGTEDASRTTAILEQLFEAMDRFQENIKEVARRMEAVGTPAPVQESEFGPPMPPTGHVGTPITPGTPISGNMATGVLSPPMAPAVAPPQPPQPWQWPHSLDIRQQRWVNHPWGIQRT